MRHLIIQARLGSTRLPGKVLKEISGRPLIDWLVRRLSKSQSVGNIVVATTNNAADDDLVEWLREHDISFFRGSEQDVLDRFYQTALTRDPEPNDAIIRICADNPLHHHRVLDFVINEFEKGGFDYFSNSNYEPDFLEDGFDVEVFRFWLLEKAWKEAELGSEREHVCPFMKKPEQFKCGWKKYRGEYNFKLSVDTQEDLNAVREIYQKLLPASPDFGMDEVIQLLKKSPEILELNKDSVINSGYRKSLEND